MNVNPCDRCGRKVWHPVPGGYMLYCYGHLDNFIGIFVTHERKKSYKVKAYTMFIEDTSQISEVKIAPEILHKQPRGTGRVQTTIEGF